MGRGMIITDYFRAIGQIGDSRFLRVLALGVGLTIALLFGFTVLFAWTIGSGVLPEMGGLTTWPAFAGTPIYAQEVWYFGTPLLVATFGGILLGWIEKAPRDRFRGNRLQHSDRRGTGCGWSDGYHDEWQSHADEIR